MSKVAAHVEEIIQPILEDLNYELVDVEYVKEGSDYYLRIAIDKDGGVDLNDCTIASEKISEVMDKEDPIKEPYFMDVSSPGAERPLKKKKTIKMQLNNLYLSRYTNLLKEIKNG